MRKQNGEDRHRTSENAGKSARNFRFAPRYERIRNHTVQDAHADERQPFAPTTRQDAFAPRGEREHERGAGNRRAPRHEGQRRNFRAAYFDKYVRGAPDGAQREEYDPIHYAETSARFCYCNTELVEWANVAR